LSLSNINGKKLSIYPNIIHDKSNKFVEISEGYMIHLESYMDIKEFNLVHGKLIYNGRININT